MGNYVIKEMVANMGNGKKGRKFPKMQVYNEFDYEKVVELVNKYSPAFSPGTVRGVLDTLAEVMMTYLPMGHSLKIDNIGVFSLALEFNDKKDESEDTKDEKKADTKKKYNHVRAKGVNFRVDKKLVDKINRESSFECSEEAVAKPSPYTLEERRKRALQYIKKHGSIGLQDYANLNKMNYSTASRELSKLVADPKSGIKAKGAGSHKVWVAKTED